MIGAAGYIKRHRAALELPGTARGVDASDELQRFVVHESRPLMSSLPDSSVRQIEEYLGSTEFQALCRQVIALRILYGKNFQAASAESIFTLRAGLAFHLRLVPGADHDIASLLFSLVTGSADKLIDRWRHLATDLEDSRFKHFLVKQEELIPKCKALLNARVAADALPWLDRYTAVATPLYGAIRAPHWDTQVVVPIDQVYVPARLKLRAAEPQTVAGLYSTAQAGDRVQRLDSWDRSRVIHELEEIDGPDVSYRKLPIDRTVVLGDPGAGKTTLATRIASEILGGKKFLNFTDTAPTVPFVVTLREYSAGSIEQSFSAYINRHVSDRLQCAAPEGLVELLLVMGRALVIFDGLDELLDTSQRRNVSIAIEAFAYAYPNTPMLVTSRSVGYDNAPLNPAVFSSFLMRQFNSGEVRKYVHNWFATDDSLKSGGDSDRVAEKFLLTTSSINDLTSNPLLLALLCNLYKATGYVDLPRSRPAVLEKCALVLFDRWDRYRGIGTVDFERDFEPVVAWIAFNVFTVKEYIGGISESVLAKLAVEFLWPRLFDTESAAMSFSRALVEHCRGRAWVFTDMGTSANGEAIYQFTHRTFLEYFTALHIFRRHRIPETVLRELWPHILASDWGLVPLLAVQIMSRRFDSAADDIILRICDYYARQTDLADLRSAFSFAGEILCHVTVGPTTIDRLVIAANRIGGGRAALPEVGSVPAENRSALINSLNAHPARK